MKYIHKNTKSIIETDCIIHSNNWLLLEEKKESKKPKKKKSGDK